VIREIKVVRDTAVKCRTQAIITLKTLVVTAPDELRHELQPLSKAKLRDRCAGLRPGKIDTPLAAAKHALKALARRWQHLDEEIKTHDRLLDGLTAQAAPALREAFGIGVDVAAEMLILAGDNPERIRSEAAFREALRRLPNPSVLRRDPAPPSELGRTPPGKQRALPIRHRPNALPPTHHRICHQTHPRRQDQARNHPLPQAIPRPRDLPPNHPIPHSHHAQPVPRKPNPKCLLTTIGASTP
jgi:transposase